MTDTTTPHGFQDPSLQAANTSVLEGLGLLASYFGFSKVVGQLFGALLLSPRPLNLDEMMEELGISKASVSMNLRSLEHMGIVHEVWIKDDRRKYYRPESDFWRIMTNVLSSRELRDVNQALRVLHDNAEAVQDAMPKMNEQDREMADFYINRLDQLQDFFGLAKLVLTSIIEQAQNQPDINEFKRLDFE
ncbi:GbsR/MarR family transcriptional regulator [Aggregatilinea lenta]|uniref:GbsR/MarR family transcriptional regulator n=1 Tax=Aggregatilinea lenta TaxID=913108 RepID=UPI000E5A55AC|nr:ArsR family transcriptional regulator [Aggregatilinea lenta]